MIRPSMSRRLTFWIAVVLHVAPAMAQQPPAPPPSPCATAAHRQFDFWIGEWEVYDGSGKRAGENRIARVHNGCALIEEWRGAGNVTGSSLNIYDKDRDVWHQTWVDSSGALLTLEGALEDGAMRMRGRTVERTSAGKATLQRISWTPQADGGVRQLWETSIDDGRTWTVAFDGWYKRHK